MIKYSGFLFTEGDYYDLLSGINEWYELGLTSKEIKQKVNEAKKAEQQRQYQSWKARNTIIE
jgi:hypothetical protein